MHGKDMLYNDLRQYLQVDGVGFPRDLCISVGEEFLKHLTSALFPLSLGVWKQLNDAHNRGGAAPYPKFGAFCGRKVMGHKKDKPCTINVVQHLQELWIGMGKLLETEN
jgi:hypothetical protein